MAKILRLQGNVDYTWKNLAFDVEKFPEGPTRERLEAIHGMAERQERVSDPDLAFAWGQAIQLERLYPEGLAEGGI